MNFYTFRYASEDNTIVIRTMSYTKTYKQLYLRFIWQFILFLLTLCITASIYQAIEKESGPTQVSQRKNLTELKESIIANFSITHKVSLVAINNLLTDINYMNDYHDGSDGRSISYMEAFMLSLSIFFTIGWGHVVPRTTGGKIFSMVSSLVGIPLTVLMIVTTAKLVIRHLQDVIRVTQANYTRKRNKYSETKISARTRSLLLPSLLILLTFYWVFTSIAIMKLENISFINSLYFSFVTLSTIGFGDIVHRSMLMESHTAKSVGLAVFAFFWLFFGMVLVASNILTVFLYLKRPVSIKRKKKAKKPFDDSNNLVESSQIMDDSV